MNNTMTGTYFKGEEAYGFNFYTNIGAANKLKLVNSVVDILVSDTKYNSIIRDLVFDFYVIDIFSDIDTKELKESPFFVNDVEQFLEETNIVDVIKVNMEIGLLEELNKAVDLAIEYRTGIHPSPLSDALASLLSTLEKKVNEIDLGSAMSMAQKFVGMTGELTPESLINAYMNSDTHKKNVVEIEEAKKQRAEFAEDMDKAIKSVSDEIKSKK